MIQLECSNCKTNLSIDDAFAGGVCRCQHCGTIQTVPKRGEAAAAGSGASPQPLFKRKARIESALNPYSDNLDRAADEIDSSGALTPSAVANLTGTKRAASSSDDSAAGSAAAYAYAGAGGTATKTKPAEAKAFVPRPSTSSAAPAPAIGASNSKAGTIAAVVVCGLIVLAGGAYLALSGDSEDGTTQDRGSVIAPDVKAPAREPEVSLPQTPRQANPIAAPATPPPVELVEVLIPTTGQGAGASIENRNVLTAAAGTSAHEALSPTPTTVATTAPAAATSATNPAPPVIVVPASAPAIPAP